jgi:localization factor PodJL
MTIEGMNRAMAWEIANLGPRARHVAEEAAQSAGMTPEEWLNEAVVEYAASAWPEDAGQGARFHGRHRETVTREEAAGEGRRPIRSGEDRRNREVENMLESSIQRIERQITRSGWRLAQAFEAVALKLERSTANLDDCASFGAGTEETTPAPGISMTPGADIVPGAGDPSPIDQRFNGHGIENVGSTRQPYPAEPRLLPESAPPKPALDLKSAVSEIALRRRQLDSREGRKPFALGRLGLETVQTNAGHDAERASPQQAQRPETDADANGACDAARARSDDPLSQAELRSARSHAALDDRLDSLCRPDQRISALDVAALRVEVAGITRSLADLAPRNAVIGLEGAVRDLTQRVEMLRQTGHRESFLAPLDAMASELRATLKAHDPQAAAAALEGEIRAIGSKIDGLAHSTINPETFERIRLQTEEVRNLLAAASVRTSPIERLERQIGELADRVERLGASSAPHLESAQMTASLAEFRREIERSTPLPTLVSIERRLEQIATRLDEEIARPLQTAFDPSPFDDLARRIDGVRETLEARPSRQANPDRLEASLEELGAKPESRDVDLLAVLMREINAKLDAAGEREVEGRSLESLLQEIGEKLDHIQQPQAPVPSGDMQTLKDMLDSLNAKVDSPRAAPLDRLAVEEIADEIAHRVQHGSAGRVEAELLAEQIGVIHDRLDALSGASRAAEALERPVRELLEKLKEAGSADNQPNFAVELAEIRSEQAGADQRTQMRLAGLQDLLEKLVARLASPGVETSMNGGTALQPQTQGAGGHNPLFNILRSADAFAAETPPGPVRRTLSPASPTNAGESSPPPADGEDFLLEPGAGGPQRGQEAQELARAIGARTNPAVSAHIAAARRAAQAVNADSAAVARSAMPTASRRVTQAKAFYDSHRRSVLLAIALAIGASVAVRLAGVHAPFLQRLELEGRPVKAARTDAPSGKDFDFAQGAKSGARPVDTTPTASIPSPAEPSKANVVAGPLPPELLAAIPAGLPQGLRDAVVAGASAAQYELAQRLLEGRELPQDQHAAALWFERAAASGFAPAQFRIGALYQKGVGVPRDAGAAKRWYTRAAEGGNARAAHNLAVMSAEPADEKPDYVEAVRWFRKAAGMGVRDSQYNLAVLYARGLGVEPDLGQSWLWFSLAAAQGDTDAGKKRDEIAAKMDPATLAGAADELAKFKVAKPNPAANDVTMPPGGWDAKPLTQTSPAAGG